MRSTILPDDATVRDLLEEIGTQATTAQIYVGHPPKLIDSTNFSNSLSHLSIMSGDVILVEYATAAQHDDAQQQVVQEPEAPTPTTLTTPTAPVVPLLRPTAHSDDSRGNRLPDDSTGAGLDCNICLDRCDDPVLILGDLRGGSTETPQPCGHLFCRQCILSWAAHDRSHECPVCRMRFSGLKSVKQGAILEPLAECFRANSGQRSTGNAAGEHYFAGIFGALGLSILAYLILN